MQEYGHRLGSLPIDKQDHHLTITSLRSMVGAGTAMYTHHGRMEIEGLHGPQACLFELLNDPGQGLVAGTIDGMKRRNVHGTSNISILGGLFPGPERYFTYLKAGRIAYGK